MGDRQDTCSRSGRYRCTTTRDRWTRTSNITGESGPRRMRMRSTYTDSRAHDVLSSLPGTARMATRSIACRPVPGLPATDGPARTRRGIRMGANSKLGIQRTGAGDTLYTTRVRQRGVINIHAELDDSNTWRACDGTPGATSSTLRGHGMPRDTANRSGRFRGSPGAGTHLRPQARMRVQRAHRDFIQRRGKG